MGVPTAARDKQDENPRQGLEETLVFWQPQTSRRLNAEDARQIIENITGFFRQLDTWDAEQGGVQRTIPIDSNVTEISAIGKTELKQEHRDCSPVEISLVA
jgi:hypothetical protein